MKIQLPLLTVIIMVLLPQCSLANESIQERFNNSLSNIDSITNVELDWIDTLSVQDPEILKFMGAKKFVRTFEYSYAASGQKYRASCKLISGTQTNLEKLIISSYDGKTYAIYNGDQHYMTTRSHDIPGEGDNAQSSLNPLVAPFMFLTKRSDQCKLCMLRFVDVGSASFTNGLVMPAGIKSGGLVKFSMPGVRWNTQPTTWTIIMNQAGKALTPKTITFTVPGLHYETINHLLNYTNLGTYEFPSKIEWVTYAYPPTIRPTILSTGLVSLISAREPDKLADSTFRLGAEKKSATTVWNWDHDAFTKTAPKLINAEAHSRIVRNILLFILFITAVAPVIIIVVKKLAVRKD